MSKATSTMSRSTSEPESSEKFRRVVATATTLRGTSIYKIEGDGVRVFYGIASEPQAPTVPLLDGVPASSFMFGELIPRLASDYRVLAPDRSGFGFTLHAGRTKLCISGRNY